MVGLALAEFRGAAPPGSLELALDATRTVDVRAIWLPTALCPKKKKGCALALQLCLKRTIHVPFL